MIGPAAGASPKVDSSFVDLSGVSATTDNPYDALIAVSHDNPVSYVKKRRLFISFTVDSTAL